MLGCIVYHCLIHGKYMTEFTWDQVCQIYALMCDDIDINVGQVIFSSMKKARYHLRHNYGFGGLLTHFLKWHKIDKKELDYKPEVVTRPVDITTARIIVGAQGPILNLAENQARANEIFARMYGLQIL